MSDGLRWFEDVSLKCSIYIILQGVGDDIPKYLQYSGSVRNRHLNKRDCAMLIKDIWHEKGWHDAQVCIK